MWNDGRFERGDGAVDVAGQRTANNAHRATLLNVVARHVDDVDRRILCHPATLRAADKQAVLPSGVLVQKTLTLELAGVLVLVSGIGDFTINRSDLRAISAALGFAHRRVGSHINPTWVDPLIEFGLPIGMVSPFVCPGSAGRLNAIVHLPIPDTESAGTDVAVSLSLSESLRLPMETFADVLTDYVALVCPMGARLVWMPGLSPADRRSVEPSSPSERPLASSEH